MNTISAIKEKRWCRSHLQLATIGIVLVLGAISAKAGAVYTVTDLGTLGGTDSTANDINEAGQIVGWAYRSGSSSLRAFLYTNGKMTDLGTLGETDSVAWGINNSGQVVGWCQPTAVLPRRAFLYSNGTMTQLGNLGVPNHGAVRINDSGQIAGWAEDSQRVSHAVLYSNGSLTDIGSIIGSDGSVALDINNNGQVVGAGVGNNHAFLYADGVVTDLGTLGAYSNSSAYGMNDSAQAVGYAYTSDGWKHAFLYANGVMTDLNGLGARESTAYDINNKGQIVGEALLSFRSHAFLYENGTMTDLNTLIAESGWTLQEAHAINEIGQIVGFGINPSGQQHAFLLDPVPEPAWLAALGFMGTVLMARRRWFDAIERTRPLTCVPSDLTPSQSRIFSASAIR